MIELEPILKTLLQSAIRITLKNKIVVDDTLILFDIKDFNIKLIFKNCEKNIPYPFHITKTKNKITFSYKLSHLHNKQSDIETQMKLCIKEKKNKYYNSDLIITI
jgi:hypothetical protein